MASNPFARFQGNRHVWLDWNFGQRFPGSSVQLDIGGYRYSGFLPKSLPIGLAAFPTGRGHQQFLSGTIPDRQHFAVILW
jgi:hypothetical protein